jgi:serine/threonine protein kinase
MGAREGFTIGRYTLSPPIAAGGMATVSLALQTGGGGFSRLVAVKRLLPRLAEEPRFTAMFLDEARLAARVRHPHVIETLDVVTEGDEVAIVLEYVEGDALSALVKGAAALGERLPIDVAASIVAAACRGLHAAHEAKGPDGVPLRIVHRDVSPQNVLVGVDGVPRVADFGIARANGRLTQTLEGELKGKPAYMAPEQLRGVDASPQTDVYAAGVVLWELCAGRRLFQARSQGELLAKVATERIPELSQVAPWIDPRLAEVVRRAVAASPTDRFESAGELAEAIQAVVPRAREEQIGAVVERLAAPELERRRAIARSLEYPSDGAPAEIRAVLASRRSRAASLLADAPSDRSTPRPSAEVPTPLATERTKVEGPGDTLTEADRAVTTLSGAAVVSAAARPETVSTATVTVEPPTQRRDSHDSLAFQDTATMEPAASPSTRRLRPVDEPEPPRPGAPSEVDVSLPIPAGEPTVRLARRSPASAVSRVVVYAAMAMVVVAVAVLVWHRGSGVAPAAQASSSASSLALVESPAPIAMTAEPSASADEVARAVASSVEPGPASSAVPEPTGGVPIVMELAPVEAPLETSPTIGAPRTSSSANLKPTGAPSNAAPSNEPPSNEPPSNEPPSNECDPPTYVDADGIRRVKKHCF